MGRTQPKCRITEPSNSCLRPRLPIVLLAVVAVLGAGMASAQLPEIPVFERDTYLIDDGTPKYPAIPPLRTSADGRVGLDFKNKRLFLLSPERLSDPFLESPPGVTMILDTSGHQLAESDLHTLPVGNVSLRHAALCDRGYASVNCASGWCPNPRPCGDDDCYDLTIVTPVRRDDLLPITIELWSTDFTVQVADPKTAGATMSAPTLSTPYQGPSHEMTTIFETMITGDGHLMVGRVGGSHRVLGNKFDIVYSVAPVASPACDVDNWTAFHPITEAHGDPQVNGRYGFAAYPLRDPTGALIPNDDDLRGTYPWIDRHGTNLFFTAISSTFWYQTAGGQPFQSRYPAACVPGTSCVANANLDLAGVQAHDDAGDTRGTSFAGLWSHGKVVLLDGLINNIDYGMKIPSVLQRMAQLYEPGTDGQGGGTGEARIGTGRHNGGGAGIYPPGYVNNSTFIDSTEQLFTAKADMVPLTLRDVVWMVNTGHASDEVAFDDWVNPNGFIVSEMSGGLSWSGGINGRHDYYDGFERTGNFTGLGFTGVQPVRVQNSATAVATEWTIPPWGEVFGDGRIEPVALGGIRGKGLWLDGQTGIRYDVVNPQPQDPDLEHWFVGLFVDARFADDSTRRTVVQFPDLSRMELEGRSTIHFVDPNGTDLASYALSSAQRLPQHGWAHLGLVVHPGGTRVRLYLDGDRIRTWNAQDGQQLFRMVPPGAQGELYVGKVEGGTDNGFGGWIDEFKVFAENPNVEVLCNHARGTRIEVTLYQPAPDPRTDPSPEPFPLYDPSEDVGQTEGATQVPAPVPVAVRYCYHDYTSEPGAHLGNLPAGATSLRRSLLFPESPLVWNQPRPDSSTNSFCLSCHVDTHVTPSLKVEALVENPALLMYQDPRRQPSHPPALIPGHIPMGYYGAGVPDQDLVAPPEGEIQDQWVFPD